MCVRQTEIVELASVTESVSMCVTESVSMCVTESVILCVTESVSMCVAERRGLQDVHTGQSANRAPTRGKMFDALRPVNQNGYIRATSDRDTAELRYLAKKRRPENVNMCKKNVATELRYVAERRRLQNFYMWQREGDYRTTEPLHVAERRRLQNFCMWQREGDYRPFGAGGGRRLLFFGGWGGGLSHHLCRPQRHCSCAARSGIPTSDHTRLIPHRGPAPRGPQETSHRWRAAIRRRHCTAAESLRWCSVVPVLFQHTQDTTYYAPYRRQC